MKAHFSIFKPVSAVMALMGALSLMPAHAGFRDDRSSPSTATTTGVSADAKGAPEARTPTDSRPSEFDARYVAPPPPPPEPVAMEAGKLMSEQLQKIAPEGWTVVWDAPPYQLGGTMTVSNDFDVAVTELMEAANGAGTRIKARFYHGNNILRVTEF